MIERVIEREVGDDGAMVRALAPTFAHREGCQLAGHEHVVEAQRRQ